MNIDIILLDHYDTLVNKDIMLLDHYDTLMNKDIMLLALLIVRPLQLDAIL